MKERVKVSKEEAAKLIHETEKIPNGVVSFGFGTSGTWLHPGQDWAERKLAEWRSPAT